MAASECHTVDRQLQRHIVVRVYLNEEQQTLLPVLNNNSKHLLLVALC